jgi:hypothetical protein
LDEVTLKRRKPTWQRLKLQPNATSQKLLL